MAEQALYKQLENYNNTIQNKYKTNWGSLMTYLEADDTKYLTQETGKNMFNVNPLGSTAGRSLEVTPVPTKDGRGATTVIKKNAVLSYITPETKDSLLRVREAGSSYQGGSKCRGSKMQDLNNSRNRGQQHILLSSSNASKQKNKTVSNQSRKLNVKDQMGVFSAQGMARQQNNIAVPDMNQSIFKSSQKAVESRKVSMQGGQTTFSFNKIGGGTSQNQVATESNTKRIQQAQLMSVNEGDKITMGSSGPGAWGFLMGVSKVNSNQQQQLRNTHGGGARFIYSRGIKQADISSKRHSRAMPGIQNNMQASFENFARYSVDAKAQFDMHQQRKGIKTNMIGTRADARKFMHNQNVNNQVQSDILWRQSIKSHGARHYKANLSGGKVPEKDIFSHQNLQFIQEQEICDLDAKDSHTIEDHIIEGHLPEELRSKDGTALIDLKQMELTEDMKAEIGHYQYMNKMKYTKQIKMPVSMSPKKFQLRKQIVQSVQNSNTSSIVNYKCLGSLTDRDSNLVDGGGVNFQVDDQVDNYVYQPDKKYIKIKSMPRQQELSASYKLLEKEFNNPKEVSSQNYIDFLRNRLTQQDSFNKRKWLNTQKFNSMTQGPGFEKLKYLYSSHSGQGDNDIFMPQERSSYPSQTAINTQARTISTRGDKQTAFGFPTIHKQSEAHKQQLRMKAGAPGEDSGNHTQIIENEKLVGRDNHLQNAYKLYQSESQQQANSGNQAGGSSQNQPPQNFGARKKTQGSLNFRNDLERLNNKLHEIRWGFGARNGYKQFGGLDSKEEDPIQKTFINADFNDDRLRQLMGGKKLYNGGQQPTMFLRQVQQEKWLAGRASKFGGKGGVAINDNQKNEQKIQKAKHRQQIEIAKDLFLIWDSDGEGSLSSEEMIKAFVRIGLCQDHHFAKKIMHSIKPQKKKKNADEEIHLKDFITIFKNDEVSDNVIEVINREVCNRKMQKQSTRMTMNPLKQKLNLIQETMQNQFNYKDDMSLKTYSISMKSEINALVDIKADVHGHGGVIDILDQECDLKQNSKMSSKKNSKGEIVVEIPLSGENSRANQILIHNTNAVGQMSSRTYLIQENNQISLQEQVKQARSPDQMASSMMHPTHQEKISINLQMSQDSLDQRPDFKQNKQNKSRFHNNTNITQEDILSSKMNSVEARPGGDMLQQSILKQNTHFASQKMDRTSQSRDRLRNICNKSPIKRPAGDDQKMRPPTFGEQTQVIQEWWNKIMHLYVSELNRNEQNKENWKEISNINDVTLNTVYDFIIKKRLVSDKQNAMKLVSQQVGFDNLQNSGKINYDEFNKLFCKGMFKVALINTINQLQTQGSNEDEHSPTTGAVQRITFPEDQTHYENTGTAASDPHKNFNQDMPLSLTIEKYQRRKMLDGLDPDCRPQQKQEVIQILQSLKFIQRYEENVDKYVQMKRDRNYQEFLADPMGEEINELERKENENRKESPSTQRLNFIEDTSKKLNLNVSVNLSKKEDQIAFEQFRRRGKKRRTDTDTDSDEEMGKDEYGNGIDSDTEVELINGELTQRETEIDTKDGTDRAQQSQGRLNMKTESQLREYKRVREVFKKHDKQRAIKSMKDHGFMAKQDQKKASNMQKDKGYMPSFGHPENIDDMIKGLINNDVQIPKVYFEKTREQRLHYKTELMGRLQMLLNNQEIKFC